MDAFILTDPWILWYDTLNHMYFTDAFIHTCDVMVHVYIPNTDIFRRTCNFVTRHIHLIIRQYFLLRSHSYVCDMMVHEYILIEDMTHSLTHSLFSVIDFILTWDTVSLICGKGTHLRVLSYACTCIYAYVHLLKNRKDVLMVYTCMYSFLCVRGLFRTFINESFTCFGWYLLTFLQYIVIIPIYVYVDGDIVSHQFTYVYVYISIFRKR